MRVVKNSTEIFIATLNRQGKKSVIANGRKRTIFTDPKLQEVYDNYHAGKIKFQGHAIEASVVCSGLKNIKFFDEADQKSIGVRSVGAAKLPDHEFFCPVEIQVLAAALADNTESSLKIAKFDTIDTMSSGELLSADISLSVNNGEAIFKEAPMIMFAGLGQATGATRKGSIVLDNTTIAKPQMRIDAEIRTGAVMPDKTGVKLVFYGTRTTPVGR